MEGARPRRGFVEGLREHGEGKKAAAGAATRKLIQPPYGTLKTGRPSDPELAKTARHKTQHLTGEQST